MDNSYAANWQAGKYSQGNAWGQPTLPGVASGHQTTETDVPIHEGDLGKPIGVNQTQAVSNYQTTYNAANIDYLKGGVGVHKGVLIVT